MNSVNDSNEMANNSADPTVTDEKRTVALLEDIAARLTALQARFELIEKRLEDLDRDVHLAIEADEDEDEDVGGGEEEPLVEPTPAPPARSYALRCDGRVLLSTRDLEDIDLSARETFTGIVLSEAEASDALDRMGNAFEETAAHSVGWLRKRGKKGGGSKE